MTAPKEDSKPANQAAAIELVKNNALAALNAATTIAELKQVRSEHFSDRSPIALANREIGQLAPEERKEAGRLIGTARADMNRALEQRTAELEAVEQEQQLNAERVDMTLPTDERNWGARHPLTLIQETVSDIFISMGWEVAEGPELEAEWLNFDALNLGPDHPARTMQDTFWVKPADAAMVLRTHTSPVQARTMINQEPPIYIVSPGRVFRTDELDATHSPVFHQIEGLAVDEGLTMAHLKGTLDHFAKVMFGEEVTTRFRPSYFPFTEPSAEVDLLCYACKGIDSDSCRTCRGEGWIEIGGCGVVNPRVLIACGVDPDRYQGFAFGIGLDRTIVGRYDMADLRDLLDGDIRLSEQFGVEL